MILGVQAEAVMAASPPNPKPPPPEPPEALGQTPTLNPAWPPEFTPAQRSIVAPPSFTANTFFSPAEVRGVAPASGTPARLVGWHEWGGTLRLWFVCGSAEFPNMGGFFSLYWCVGVRGVYMVR